VSRKKYSKLFAALGTNWGNPSPKRFNIPDLRGRFLRGVDDNTGRDPEAHKRQPANPGGNSGGAGSVQNDSIQNHTHRDSGHSHPYIHVHNSFRTVSTASLDVSVVRTYGPYSEKDGRASLRGAVKYGTGSDIRAGEESRPKNAAIYYIIKAK
jgi:microcystin-dependent protein